MISTDNIKNIGLSSYSVNALLANGIQTVADIREIGIDNLMKCRRIGSRVYEEVSNAVGGDTYKKTVTLNDFAAQIRAVAHSATRKRYFSVSITLRDGRKQREIEFQAYIENIGLIKGKSMESCVGKAKEALGVTEIPKVII